MIIIREAKLRDSNDILELWTEFMKYHDDVIITNNPSVKPFLEKKKNAQVLFLKHIKRCIRSKNSVIFVAEEKNSLIGYSLNQIKKNIPIFKIEKLGYFSDLFVKKEYRGKGISSKFKKKAIAWFKKKRLTTISIAVYPENEHAHSIYKRWGFRDTHIEMRRKI